MSVNLNNVKINNLRFEKGCIVFDSIKIGNRDVNFSFCGVDNAGTGSTLYLTPYDTKFKNKQRVTYSDNSFKIPTNLSDKKIKGYFIGSYIKGTLQVVVEYQADVIEKSKSKFKTFLEEREKALSIIKENTDFETFQSENWGASVYADGSLIISISPEYSRYMAKIISVNTFFCQFVIDTSVQQEIPTDWFNRPNGRTNSSDQKWVRNNGFFGQISIRSSLLGREKGKEKVVRNKSMIYNMGETNSEKRFLMVFDPLIVNAIQKFPRTYPTLAEKIIYDPDFSFK